jgi:Protein of unknwon function (DUF3310)
MTANNKQHGGNHYKKYGELQPWDVVIAWELGYLEGTALKYIARWRDKNGVEDILKAIHFLEKLVEVEKQKQQAVDLEGVMQVWQGKPIEWELDAMDNRNE